MSNLKEKIINAIIDREGGEVNDSLDSGGHTKFGITESVARANDYHGPMRELSRDTAFVIYSQMYWGSVRGDDLLKVSKRIAEEVVDTAVNMGPGRAGEFLQRSLNALNDRERLYSDVKIDGAIGAITLSRLAMYLYDRDEHVLAKMLNCLQGAFYVELAERREKDERFIYGWFKNRVTL